MKTGIDPKVDYAFKKLFGSASNTPLLLDLLNAVLDPPADERIVALEILNPFNDKDALDDKLSILDDKARDSLGRLYNVEMEMAATRIFPNRVLYYWSVLHSSQLQSGDPYETLRPTISISFLNDVLFPLTGAFHSKFQVRSVGDPAIVFSPHLSMHLIELPKFVCAADALKDALDRWCYFLVHGASLDATQLPEQLKVKPVEVALEVMEMMSKTEKEWFKYQDRLKAVRDEHMRLQDATEKGVEKGVEKERIQSYVRQIQLCQRILKAPQSSAEELQCLGLAELQARAEELERRCIGS